MPRTAKQKRAALAARIERSATPANPKVKAGEVTLSAAQVRAVTRALRS